MWRSRPRAASATAAWWVATQHRELRRTRSELLLASAAAFAASILFDQLGAKTPVLSQQLSLLFEDACKFLGILAWAQYFVLTSADIVRSIVNGLRSQTLASQSVRVGP